MRLALVGDIMLTRRVAAVYGNSPDTNSKSIISESVSCIFKKQDFVVGNFENPSSFDFYKAEIIEKGGFCCNPSMIDFLKDFDAFSLANNHIFDKGKSIAKETKSILHRKGFNSFGFFDEKGLDQFDLGSTGFVMLSCAVDYCIKNEDGFYPHLVEVGSEILHSKISALNKIGKKVIVAVHGGEEMISIPEPKFVNSCRSLIDNGATLVVTHHPHVVGCSENYKDGFIFYGLGDFIFDGESFLRRQGVVLIVESLNNSASLKIEKFFTNIKDDFTVTIASDFESFWRSLKFKVKSKLVGSNIHFNFYPFIYFILLVRFQFSRLIFKLTRYGFKHVLKFILEKKGFLTFYLKKIFKNN